MKGKRWLVWLMVFTLTVGTVLNMIPAQTVTAAGSTTIKIHYQRPDGDYEKWNLWIWPEGGEGQVFQFTEEDKFGKVAIVTLPVDTKRVGFIVRTDTWDKDMGDDRFIEVSGGSAEVWVYSGQAEFLTEAPAGFEVDTPTFEKVQVKVHYFRYDQDYKNWAVWLWKDGQDAHKVEVEKFSGSDAYGKVATVTIDKMSDIKKIGLYIRKGETEKDIAEERFISVARADEKGKIEVYLMQGETKIGYREADMDRTPTIVKAAIEAPTELNVQVNVPFKLDNTSGGFVIKSGAKVINIASIEAVDGMKDGYTRRVKITPTETLAMDQAYTIAKAGYGEVPIGLGNVYGSQGFKEMFHYEKNDLGAVYTKEKTAFRVWTPTASEVNLLLYPDGHNSEIESTVPMIKDTKGTWVASVEGDQKGKFYTYQVTVNGQVNEATDPYAKAVGVNGIRAMVADLSETNPEGWAEHKKPEFKNFTDAIIYELHVRDLSIHKDSGINQKGKFLGIIEKGTKTSDGEATGLDHMLDLGITHLHLLPSFDFQTIDETKLDRNDFNWGYDPQNYNVPEGSYATDPYSGTKRVEEFKEMVKVLHENGIRVILDVVYNHTGKTSNSHLNLLVPDYYYRQNENGGFSNGSGCGNETASERSMVRKMIVDSVKYWAEEYKIDGFRFDLMGLHDIDTMNEVRAELDKVDPTILLYGEGWTGGSSPLPDDQKALKINTMKLNGIAAFSDDIRDGIKGSVFNEQEAGFVNGAANLEESIKFGIVASTQHPQVQYGKVNYSKAPWANGPEQTITYASAHDNHTLWDKIKATNPKDSEEERIKMNLLSQAIVFTSQGIPFLHAGEEMLRTKFGDHNSYKSPDAVNQLDWTRKGKYKHVYEYYKGLIALRKAHPAFRMTTTEDIQKNLKFMDMPTANMVGYTIDNNANGDSFKTIAVLFNANTGDQEVTLPSENWGVLVNGEKAGTEVLAHVTGNKVLVPARSALVLVDGDSAGLTVQTVAQVEPEQETQPTIPKTNNTAKVILWVVVLAGIIGGTVVFMKKNKKKK